MSDIIDTQDTQELSFEELFGEKNLRWYQIACRNATIAAIARGEKRVLIELPTGAGKTITVASTIGDPMMMKALGIADQNRKLRVLFVAHKHRLLTQAEQTFADAYNVELIIQSMFTPIPQSVIDAGWDICVLDEAHHEACASFQYQLEKLGDYPVIGLTATKDRADGCLIKFDAIINPISREQAVAEGWLAKTKLNTIVDVPSKDKIAILTRLLEQYSAQMTQTMVFVKTKKEVTAITNVLLSLGHTAVGILSQTESQLNTLLNQFSNKEVQFLVNCNRVNEGVDVVGCEHVVLGRQFGSYPQLNQVIGRAARPDSECNVWELINPLSGRNLDTSIIVGTPETHRLISMERGEWVEREFNYTSVTTNAHLGIAAGTTM